MWSTMQHRERNLHASLEGWTFAISFRSRWLLCQKPLVDQRVSDLLYFKPRYIFNLTKRHKYSVPAWPLRILYAISKSGLMVALSLLDSIDSSLFNRIMSIWHAKNLFFFARLKIQKYDLIKCYEVSIIKR